MGARKDQLRQKYDRRLKQIRGLSNADLLAETLCMAAAGDYDGALMPFEVWECRTLQEELQNRLADWLLALPQPAGPPA